MEYKVGDRVSSPLFGGFTHIKEIINDYESRIQRDGVLYIGIELIVYNYLLNKDN